VVQNTDLHYGTSRRTAKFLGVFDKLSTYTASLLIGLYRKEPKITLFAAQLHVITSRDPAAIVCQEKNATLYMLKGFGEVDPLGREEFQLDGEGAINNADQRLGVCGGSDPVFKLGVRHRNI
jgi:hypothetical protein